MRIINESIVHCSYTKPSMENVDADWIRRLHVNQNGWKDIGYHFVILRDGTIEGGRNVEKAGAHCRGHNRQTIGICLIGGMSESGEVENNFTTEQFAALKQLDQILKLTFPTILKTSGHRDYSTKPCPGFDVNEKLLES